ncbi:hypothetical protein [Nocardia sp. NPDC004604]|uniref:hypothetical protein n=1 Tax=Nocardia sp. NPDC004604 TaxID=3157013 RepID=UPI0033A8EB99
MMEMQAISSLLNQNRDGSGDRSDKNDTDSRRRRNEGQPVAVQHTPTTPPTVTGTKSMVDMKIPGVSRSQQVSSVVADAVNKELNNPNGCDARAAYAGTPGQSAPDTPWTQVSDPHLLHTGDVVEWANRSAIVVVTDSGLQIIVNGHLAPFDPNNPANGGTGAYGDFRYFHPTGTDLTTNTQQAQSAPPTPPPNPPAVTPPSTPGSGIPAVTSTAPSEQA